jgi:uncharacterized protein (DUF58 family)
MPTTVPALARYGSLRGSLTDAKALSAELPDLLIEARRLSATVIAGWHGRRIAGPGETFWQFRQFVPGETASDIDWRRSARDDHYYVREKEWEAAHMVWLWADLSRSMTLRSRLAPVPKRDRALVLLLALADLLAVAGERVGLLGDSDPILGRNAAERLAEILARLEPRPAEPDARPLRQFSDLVLFGDFFDPIEELEAHFTAIARSGTRAHLVQVVDPAEETFPHSGRIEFRDPETGATHVLGRAELYRDEYAAMLGRRREWLQNLCRRLDWTCLVHRTDRPATEPLLALHARLADRHSRPAAHAGGHAA